MPPGSFAYVQRVRPQECAASTFLGHPRFLEFFEAAFIECWRARFGKLEESLGADRRLTVAEVEVRYVAPVRADDDLRVDVALTGFTDSSVQVRYDAFVDDAPVAEAGSRYVCLDGASGRPTPWPGWLSEN